MRNRALSFSLLSRRRLSSKLRPFRPLRQLWCLASQRVLSLVVLRWSALAFLSPSANRRSCTIPVMGVLLAYKPLRPGWGQVDPVTAALKVVVPGMLAPVALAVQVTAVPKVPLVMAVPKVLLVMAVRVELAQWVVLRMAVPG